MSRARFKVGQLILSGRLRGEVNAVSRVVLHKTADLQGNLRTPTLVIEEGAVLEGKVNMGSMSDTAELPEGSGEDSL